LVGFATLTVLAGVSAANPFANLTYRILAPLPAGVRETWVDTLEAFGGIDSSAVLQAPRIPTELADGGNVTWFNVTSDGNGAVSFDLPTYRADFLEEALGTAVSMQGWALATFVVSQESLLFVNCLNVDSFYVDGIQYVGDKYALNFWFSSSSPDTFLTWPLHLSAGTHHLKVHLTDTFFQCSVRPSPLRTPSDALYPLHAESSYARSFNPGLSTLYPDVVNGTLAGGWVSVLLGNAGDSPLASSSVQVTSVSPSGNTIKADDTAPPFSELQPGQVFPTTVHLLQSGPIRCNSSGQVEVELSFAATDASGAATRASFAVSLDCKSFPSSPYRFTFLDGSGAVQYAEAIPPAAPCASAPITAGARATREVARCPLLFSTHGAGVDGSSVSWVNAYHAQSVAWILLPSGTRAFGYDWQGPARMNGLAAAAAFAADLPGVPDSARAAYAVDTDRVLFSGHSMGGHGCLVFSTHYTDVALASMCTAGWIKMYEYILYAANIGHSFTDASMRGILRSAVVDYDTDVFAPHLKGVPTLVRMGGNDTNVSPWNLRRFARIVAQHNGDPASVPVNEIPGQPHWWGGVVDDAFMQSYIDTHIYATKKPSLPASFTVVANGLWGTGRGGIKVLQQRVTRRLSTIGVDVQRGTALMITMSTRNVRRFGFTRTDLLFDADGLGRPHVAVSLVVDGAEFRLDTIPTVDTAHFCFVGNNNSAVSSHPTWQLCSGSSWTETERSEQSYGPVRQVLNGPLVAVFASESNSSRYQAVGIANQLMVQTHAAVRVLSDSDAVRLSSSDPSWLTATNFIIVGAPTSSEFLRLLMGSAQLSPSGRSASGPMLSLARTMQFEPTNISLNGAVYAQPGIGVLAFGAILPQQRAPMRGPGLDAYASPTGGLVAVVAGTDDDGVAAAAALFPRLSNMEVPDFVVLDAKRSKWQGAGGFLATGFWGHSWGVEQAMSYIDV